MYSFKLPCNNIGNMGLENVEGVSVSSDRTSPSRRVDVRDVEEKDMEYFLGLIAGEGCFTIAMRKDSSCRLGYYPLASVSVTADDCDKEHLESIKEMTGVGHVNPNHNQTTCQWVINSTRQSKSLMDAVDNYLDNNESFFKRSEKYQSYKRWKECVNIIDNGEHKHRRGMERLLDLKVNINESNKGGGMSKDEWIKRLYE